jgi:signal transduction histidine kinase
MRVRLIGLVGATSSLILVAFLVPLALLVRSAVADRALSAAIVEVQAFAPAVATSDEATVQRALAQANGTSVHQLTVFFPNGHIVGAPAPRSAAVTLGQTGTSSTTEIEGGREVVVAVAGLASGTAVVRTFVPDAELSAGVVRSWLVLGLLGLGLLAVSVLVADQLARSLTRPLSAVARVSHRLAQGGLDARAADEGPSEVRQLSAGLNLLASRIAELLAQERATVADLSHRLRTPLTVLRIDLESLTDPESRSRLMADLDAVDRTVDAVIREADRPVREGVAASCDAAEVVADRLDFWSVVADEERRRVDVVVARGPVIVKLSRDDLSACVDALIGNVFTHTAPGTPFEVRLSNLPSGGARLVMSDHGPGINEGSVLRRGASGGGSTGLGLDIVARAAERSGGSVRVNRANGGGAEITVDFGPPPPHVVRTHRHVRSRR